MSIKRTASAVRLSISKNINIFLNATGEIYAEIYIAHEADREAVTAFYAEIERRRRVHRICKS